MSLTAARAILRRAEPEDPTDRLIALIVALAADNTGVSRARVEQISRLARVNDRRVADTLAQLVTFGVLELRGDGRYAVPGVARRAPTRQPATPRAADPVWDAMVAAMGHEPASATERAKWNRAVKILKDAGSTGDDVRDRVAAYRRTYPNVACTPLAVAAHWGELAPRRQREAVDVLEAVDVFVAHRREWRESEVVDDVLDRFGRGRSPLDRAVFADRARQTHRALNVSMPAADGGIIPSSTPT